MSLNPEAQQIFQQHFGFLEKEYGFQIQSTKNGTVNLFTASTAKCVLTIAIPEHPNGWPMVMIGPAGTVSQALSEQEVLARSLNLSLLALCFDPALEWPKWWEMGFPRLTLPVLGQYLQKYCQKMLRGDFSEWPFLQKRIQEIADRRGDEFRKNYQPCGYQVIEQAGKYGLTHNNVPVLEPIYTSVAITNDYSHHYDLDNIEDEDFVSYVAEYNFPIVIADGKYGLLSRREFRMGLEYDWIVKLTYREYLFRQGAHTYFLYNVDDLRQPLASFIFPGKLDLEKLLEILQIEHPDACARLKVRLRREGARYISEYYHYGGTQEFDGYIHHFRIAEIKMALGNDFSVSPL